MGNWEMGEWGGVLSTDERARAQRRLRCRVTSPERQARWIKRQMQLADRAGLAAVTQITYTDLDLSTYPVPPGSILGWFAYLGLVETDFKAKPALAEWDRAFARPLRVP